MKDERFKEIMNDLGMPNSQSLMIALEQVANEVAQEIKNESMNDNLEEIGQVADTLDNLIAAMGMMNLPAEIHLKALRESLPEASLKIKKAVIAETGEDPWGLAL